MNTIQSISLDAKIIYERLKKTGVGDVATYEELNTLIGRNVQESARGLMETARRRALALDRIAFGTVMNVGLKRLDDVEIVATGERAIVRIRRISGRALKTITAVANFDAMPNDSRVRHNAYASIFGAISHATRGASVHRVEGRVSESQSALPLAKTLEAFRG